MNKGKRDWGAGSNGGEAPPAIGGSRRYNSGVEFEWDPAKASTNLTKHGVAFDEAATIFGDSLSVTMRDPDHSIDEDRYVVVGMSNRQRALLVAYSERGTRVRIISARQLTRSERRAYENSRKEPR